MKTILAGGISGTPPLPHDNIGELEDESAGLACCGTTTRTGSGACLQSAAT